MYYAYGWAQMQNHGDLILKLYGQARGRASEYGGENTSSPTNKSCSLKSLNMLKDAVCFNMSLSNPI